MNALALFILLIFGVMGFGVNFFFRLVYVYCEWREGNTIDWRFQSFVTLCVPIAYTLALGEIMLATGLIVIP